MGTGSPFNALTFDDIGTPTKRSDGSIYLGEYGEALWRKKLASDQALKQAAEWIARCRALLVGAGAGMSVDSGLGTYRGASMGVWPPLKALDIDYREICTPDAILEHPQLTWAFWRHCILAYRSAVPHEGYGIVRRWADKARLGGFCYTTNVDAMWPKAFPENCVYEVHGSTSFFQCSDARGSCPSKGQVWPCPDNFAEQCPLEPSKMDSVEMHALPHCAACGKIARPNVNLFGDFDFSKKRGRLQKARYQEWLQEVDADLTAEVESAEQKLIDEEASTEELECPSDESVVNQGVAETELLQRPVVCIEIGAGISIPTVRTALEGRSAQPGHVLIRINPEYPELPAELEASGRAVAIRLPALDALRRINDYMLAFG
jgi:NAD-dependent SIR2 family protein deacetylase